MKIFQKFVISLLVVALIPLVLYTIILLNTTGKAVRQLIDRANAGVVRSLESEVNKYFVDLENSLDAARSIERDRTMTSAQKTALLFYETRTNRIIMGAFLIERSGAVVCGMAPPGEQSEIDLELVRRAAETGSIETGPFRRTSDQEPYVDIVYPFDGASGQSMYYRFRLRPLLNRLEPHIQETGQRREKIVVLVDREGGMLCAPEAAGFERVNITDCSGAKPYEVFETGRYVGVSAHSRGPSWLVVLLEPKNAAYAPARAIVSVAFLLIILAGVLAVAGAYAMAKNLSQPITRLTTAMETVAKGDLDYRISPGSPGSRDELGRMMLIFNTMASDLKKLQDDVKKSERLSTVGQMANIMAHEIRNPLTAITNAVYLIKRELTKKESLTPSVESRIRLIEEEILSTQVIINDILDYSRNRPPVRTLQDINQLITSIIDATEHPEGIAIDLKLSTIPQIPVDVEEMKQVIRNLVNNAADSMDKTGGRITIRTFRTVIARQDAPAVGLEIADTGCGIPAEILGKIFEPFFSTKSKGTGLGLAVIQRIVQERHKGQVEVQSEQGKGTSFLIRLPVTPPDDPPAPDKPQAS